MRSLSLLLFSLALASCSSDPAHDGGGSRTRIQTATTSPLEIASIEGVATLSRVGNLMLGGQPSELALGKLREAGVTTILDLRMPAEDRGYDEHAVVTTLGMEYMARGFAGPSAMTDERLDEFRLIFTQHRRQGMGIMLVHSASSNRVGALWLAGRVLDEEVPWEHALAEAHTAGLRSKEMEAYVTDYVLGGGNSKLGKIKLEIREKLPMVARISVAELGAKLGGAHAPLLFDVRAKEEYDVSHLPGAYPTETLDEALTLLVGQPLDREVVVYCSVGYRSGYFAEKLTAEGFTRVLNLEGSIFEWANGGRAVYRQGSLTREVHPYDPKWGMLLNQDLWAAGY